MKKIIGGLSAVVLVAAGVGPVITGNIAEKEMKALVDAVNAESQAILTLDSYEKSFLGAQAALTLKLVTGVPELDVKTIPLQVSVDHGPILFKQATLGLTAISTHLSSKAVGFENLSTEANIASYSVIYDFTGQLSHNIQLAALVIKDQSSLSFSGVNGTFFSNADFTAVQGDVGVGELAIGYNDAVSGVTSNIIVEPSEITFDWSQVVGHESLMTGFSEWKLPKATVNSGMFNIELNQLSIDASSQVNEGKIYLGQSLKIASLIGPVKVEALNYDVKFTDIELATYDAFINLSNAIQNMQQTGVELSEDEMTALMKPVFQKGIKNSQHLSLQMGGGDIKADFDAEYVGDASTVDALIAQNDQVFLSSVEGGLSVVADSSAVMATPLALMVPGWVKQGLVTMRGDTFTFNADVKDAMLNLNGQVIPLQSFLETETQREVEQGSEIGVKAEGKVPTN